MCICKHTCHDNSDLYFFIFFFNDTATTEIYTLSYTTLFRSSPSPSSTSITASTASYGERLLFSLTLSPELAVRSEEHTSELQSHVNLVCRLLLEKKNKKDTNLIPGNFVYSTSKH